MNKVILPMLANRVLFALIIYCSFAVAALAQPSFDKAFFPSTIGPGSVSTLTFTIINADPVNPVTDLAFVDNLPAGMSIANAPAIVTDCVNMLITAPAGGSTITASNGRLSAGAFCIVSINATTAVVGVSMNVSGDLTSSAGNSGTASADLTVVTDRPGFSKSFSPSSVNFGDRSTLTFSIDNTLNASNVFSLQFIDNFPTGMRVADPANASTTCTGGVLTALPDSRSFAYGPAFGGDATLAAGASCTVTVDVGTSAAGPLGNTSDALQSTTGFTSVNSGLAADTLDVLVSGEIILLKSFDGDPLPAGSSLSLTFELTNLDRVFTATNISFSDDLDATLSGLIATGLPLNDVCGAGSQITGSSVLTLTGGSLPPEGNCVFSVDVQIPAAAVVGAYPNTTSSVTGDLGGSPATGNPASDTLFVSDAPLLSKTFLSNPVGAAEPFSMEFTITNVSSTSAATDISLQDNLSAFLSGHTVTSLPASGFCGAGSQAFTFFSFGQNMLTINGANLAAGASCTFVIDLTSAPGTPAGDYINTTSAIAGTVNGVEMQGQTASDTLTVISAPRLNKNFTDNPALPGGTVTLEFTIEHEEDAPADATSINFTDDLNAVVAGLSAVGLPMNDVCGTGSQISGTTNISFTGGTLTPGSSCTFSVTLQIPAGATPGVFANITSNLSAMVLGVTTIGAPAGDDLVIGGLSFSKAFTDDPVIAGAMVTLEFTLDNTSSAADASGISFNDNLSGVLPGLTAIAPLPVDPCGAGSVVTGTSFLIFAGGNLTTGTSCTFSVTLQVPAGAANGSFRNVTSNLAATINGNVAVLPPAADNLVVNSDILLFSKTFTDDPVAPGDTVTLEFTLSNQDTAQSVSGITFTDDLDAALSGLSAVGLPVMDVCGAGSQLSGSNLLTLTSGNLAAGASCTFSVTLQVPAGAPTGSFVNTTSQANGTAGGLPVSSDPATDTLLVQSVGFSKAFANPLVTGSTTTLSFTIQNNSSSALDSISFSDDLDAVSPGLVALGLPANDVCGAGSQLSGTSFLTLSGGNLLPSGSCTFMVTVMAPAGGTPGVFTNVTSDLFVSGLTFAEPATADLQVVGIPNLSITPLTIDFADVLVSSSSTSMDVLLENTGNDDLNITSIPTAVAPFAMTGGSCVAVPFTLTAGTSCTLSYNYSPAVTGPAMQMFAVTSNAPGSPDSFALQGNGIQPAIGIVPNLVDFGDQLITTTSSVMTTTLTNTGTADLNVMSITAAATPFAVAGGSCAAAPLVLAPGTNCTLDFTFTPTVAGPALQNLSIVSGAPTTPDILTLQGNGTQAGLGVNPNPLDFGNVNINTMASLPLTLTNTGDGELTISAIGDPLAPYTVDNGSCGVLPIVLAPSAQCDLDISFAPAVIGPVMATFDLTSNAPSSPDTVTLNGNGVQPQLMLDLDEIDFDIVTVGVTDVVSLVLMNVGDGDLTITDITDPMAPFAVLPGNCGAVPFTLVSGAQCQLEITFRPTTSREFLSSFDIASNAADSPATVSLRGVGLLVEVPALNQWMLMLLAGLLLLVAIRSDRISVHLK